jgi:tetratricopeptide (TPR) repeat protein
MSDHYSHGHALFELKRYGDAAEAFKRSLADDPDDPLSHAMLAAALTHLNATEYADQAVRRAIALDPAVGYSFYILSIVEFQRQRFTHAEQAINESLRLDPTPDAYHQAAWIAHFNTRHEEALAFTDDALSLDAEHTPTVLLRGKLLIHAGRLDEAHALYSAALARNPENAATQHAFGSLHLRSGDAPAALGMLREARRLDPVTSNDVMSISLAYGRMLGPIRNANRRLLRWHLWPAERQCLLFAALAIVLTVGSSVARAHDYVGAFSQWWFLGSLTLSTYLFLPFSLDCAAAGAGQFALRRELNLTPVEAFGRVSFLALIPAAVLQALALYVAILLIVPAIALLISLLLASFCLLRDNLRTQYGRYANLGVFIGLGVGFFNGALSRHLAGVGVDRLWISVLIAAAAVAVVVLVDALVATLQPCLMRVRPLSALSRSK